MLERVAALRRSRRVKLDGAGGVLVKRPKPRQDSAVDLPAIGPRTIAKARRAGLRGVAVAAGPWSSSSGQTLVRRRRVPGFSLRSLGMSARRRPLNIALVVGEHSGDQLGFKLMRALKRRSAGTASLSRASPGEAMQAEGMDSLFPLDDIAVMGILPVVARLPTHRQAHARDRRRRGGRAPDVLVIIDSPDFTHAVAKRVRKRLPTLPIVDYVSPSVWAWRQGRARKMRAYVDHVLALLPFEPAAHRGSAGRPALMSAIP